MRPTIAVIGAGVIGLTSGIRLLEQGYDVSIFARDIETHLASRAAPALWIPYKAAPEALILKWAARSLDIYHEHDQAAGIQQMEITELYHHGHDKPLWTTILKNYRALSPAELLPGYVEGFSTAIYQIDTSIYVDYLLQQFKLLGGHVFQKTLQHLHDISPAFNLLINCSGVGSHQLVPDLNTFPIRGQYLLVKKPPDLQKISFATIDDSSYILIVPRQHDCYLGGTTIENDWDTAVRPETTATILQNAYQLEPSLRDMPILHAGVGLRPGRKTVRLEAETLPDGRTVIHNYGHGGSGFTVGWGCAEEVVKIVKNVKI
jgi:D-amino-acid oxidase